MNSPLSTRRGFLATGLAASTLLNWFIVECQTQSDSKEPKSCLNLNLSRKRKRKLLLQMVR